MTFGEERRKAFDFCADATKQLITLSSAIVAFTVTFGKDFLGAVPSEARLFAYVAWAAHLLSILFGLVVLLALTAQLEPKKPPSGNFVPSIRGAAATYSALQIILFLIAMALTAVFGLKAAAAQPVPTPTTTPTVESRLEKLEVEVARLAIAVRNETDVRAKANLDIQSQTHRLELSIADLRRSGRRTNCARPAPPIVCCAASEAPTPVCQPRP